MPTLLSAQWMTGLLAGGLALLGAWLLFPAAATQVRRLPRAPFLGIALSTLCWIWVGLGLWFHPVDLLAFLTPGRLLCLTTLCAILSPLLLQNLLCARAIGGLLMLWPMPIILAVRDQVTLWRLVPVTLGYASLTFGMFVVFYPWLLRVVCDWIAEHPRLRQSFAGLLLGAAALTLITLCPLGKVVGQ